MSRGGKRSLPGTKTVAVRRGTRKRFQSVCEPTWLKVEKQLNRTASLRKQVKLLFFLQCASFSALHFGLSGDGG